MYTMVIATAVLRKVAIAMINTNNILMAVLHSQLMMVLAVSIILVVKTLMTLLRRMALLKRPEKK
mgnify:CR=1 FL=1